MGIATFLLIGCSDSGGSGSVAPTVSHYISGKVIGVDADGGTIVLYDKNGDAITIADNTVEGDGSYRLGLPSQISCDDYYILEFDKNGKNLRAVLVGYNGSQDYVGEDTNISPYTEAMYLMSDLTNQFRVSDYMAFLGSCEAGVYDGEHTSSYECSFREIMDDVVLLVQEFMAGDTQQKPGRGYPLRSCKRIENY
ncbi:MAG: hypothetical protein BA861_11095 [Desulfobacterales bacterium S3730MH5]|nr:MAG: hypothetical protein BA861_11095 [Desulfobacterales bacterium S3730MH5]OEU84049.1 MAG: hypothetical protein BA865_03080 [Desulfobacterales bacterium S5133MH4]